MYFENLIDPDKRNSELVKSKSFHNVVIILFSFITLFAFALGFVSIFGANWFEFSRGLKITSAYSIVAIGISIFIYTAIKKKHIVHKREFASVLVIALISIGYFQFSYIYGLRNSEIQLCAFIVSGLCALVLRSGLAIVSMLLNLLLIGISDSTFGFSDHLARVLMWFVLTAFVIYNIQRQLRPGLVSIKGVLILWVAAITLPLQLISLVSHLQLIIFPLVLTCFYLFGKLYLSEAKSFLARPFQSLATLYTLGFTSLLVISYGGVLKLASIYYPFLSMGNTGSSNKFLYNIVKMNSRAEFLPASKLIIDYILVVLLALAVIFLKRRLKDCKVNTNWFVVNFPLFTILAFVLCYYLEWNWIGWFIILVYSLLFSLSYLFGGINSLNLPKTIFGFISLWIFLGLRYMDSDMGSTGLGVLFILFGLSLLFLRFLFKMKMEDAEMK